MAKAHGGRKAAAGKTVQPPRHGIKKKNKKKNQPGRRSHNATERRLTQARQPSRELVAKKTIPKPKYKSYFEFVDNTDKRKKLDFQITTEKTPPPGFTFVPVGNPDLTKACKELSREQGFLIFIVSGHKDYAESLGANVHRKGYHFRSTVVEEAALETGGIQSHGTGSDDVPEPIPETQEEIDKQAYDTLRDLYPRMPFSDMEQIVQHAFRKDATFGRGKKLVVGMQADLTLSRRVQLAVLAHTRHQHTRYDELLRETDWANARKAVEQLCLDTLRKWRGDEETGRDQLEEIMREVVLIPDTDDENAEDDDDEVDGSEQETTGSDDEYTQGSDDSEDAESDEVEIVEIQDHNNQQSRRIADHTRQRDLPHSNTVPVGNGANQHIGRETGTFSGRNGYGHGSYPTEVSNRRYPVVMPSRSSPQFIPHTSARVVEPSWPVVVTRTPGHPVKAHLYTGRSPIYMSQPGSAGYLQGPSATRARDPQPIIVTERPLARQMTSQVVQKAQDVVLPSIERPMEPARPVFRHTLPLSPDEHEQRSDHPGFPEGNVAHRVVLVNEHGANDPNNSEGFIRLPPREVVAKQRHPTRAGNTESPTYNGSGAGPIRQRPSLAHRYGSPYQRQSDRYHDDRGLTERVASLVMRDGDRREYAAPERYIVRSAAASGVHYPREDIASTQIYREVQPLRTERSSYRPVMTSVDPDRRPVYVEGPVDRAAHEPVYQGTSTSPFITLHERQYDSQAQHYSRVPEKVPLRRFVPSRDHEVASTSGPVFVRRVSREPERNVIVLD